MFDNKSDYAVNKKEKDWIVYRGCDGNEQRITRSDFATEEEFLFWKKWSDEDYQQTDYEDAYYHRHIVSLDSTGGSILTDTSPEEILISKIDRDKRVQQAKTKVFLLAGYLTKVQFRRIWHHYALGENVRQIALQEGVVHSCIVASIKAAMKKIFEKAEKSTTKTS